MKAFEKELVELFRSHCQTGLYELISNLLDHNAGDLGQFGMLPVLDISMYKHYNVHIKNAADLLPNCWEQGL